jgi:hypothetical protein
VPAKPGKEQPLLNAFISVYENDKWAGADRDWVDEHEDGAVDVVARRSDEATLAIEHTLIQPYPHEREDFARFARAFLGGDRDRSLEIPETLLRVDVPAGTLRRGDDWAAVAEAVRDCIRRSLLTFPEGRSDLACPPVGGNGTLQIYRQAIPGHEGRTIFRRYGAFDIASTIRDALTRKLPKLAETQADRRILMLERDQWHLDHTAIAAGLESLRSECPLLASIDEIWIAETHDNRDIVLFALVRPDGKYESVYTFAGERLLDRRDQLD